MKIGTIDAGRKAPAPEEVGIPYLPGRRGRLKEMLVEWRFRLTYWVWKRRIDRHASKAGGPIAFLEAGCGSGNFVRCLERWFRDANLTAFDMSPQLVRYTAQRSRTSCFLQASAEELPFAAGVFDVVSALQVIEHFPNPERFLAEAYRVLAVEGLLLLATPNPRGLAARLLGLRWGGYRHDHISLRTPEEWRGAVERNGFEILSEGTTLFNGIPIAGRFPISLPFQFLQAIYGWFPWRLGESYMAIAKKRAEH